MRMLGAIAISVALASIASADVFVTVYRCDGQTPLPPKDPNTPHVYRDIMVGTRLVLVISSDAKGLWWGGLQLTWDDWEVGKLVGRGFDPNSEPPNYAGSCLKAAGWRPAVTFAPFTDSVGFDLASHSSATPGDWFVLDYYAENAGSCKIAMFDYYGVSPDVPELTAVLRETLTFTHVPSRDLDGNGIVNFVDFASLASHWRQPTDPNAAVPWPDDINADQFIRLNDLAMFADYWLERTDCAVAPEPNAPPGGL